MVNLPNSESILEDLFLISRWFDHIARSGFGFVIQILVLEMWVGALLSNLEFIPTARVPITHS